MIYIVDFSYDATTLVALESAFECPVRVIDHHKSAEAGLMEFDRLKDNEESGVFFCLYKSGCVMTWDFFFKGSEETPDILLYVQDRDLWKFEIENSKEVNAYIATMDEDFEVWDSFFAPVAYDCGVAILKFQQEQIKRRLKDVVLRSLHTPEPFFNNYPDIPFVNASENQSELGDALCRAYPEAPFSVSYCDRANGVRSYSLRSRNGFDVSVVCKAMGGGSHPGAGGFTLDAPDVI